MTATNKQTSVLTSNWMASIISATLLVGRAAIQVVNKQDDPGLATLEIFVFDFAQKNLRQQFLEILLCFAYYAKFTFLVVTFILRQSRTRAPIGLPLTIATFLLQENRFWLPPPNRTRKLPLGLLCQFHQPITSYLIFLRPSFSLNRIPQTQPPVRYCPNSKRDPFLWIHRR